MGRYDVAQVCLNGHMVAPELNRAPQHAAKFCLKCGAATTSACASCGATIRGTHRREGVRNTMPWTPPIPAYCRECGKPFPWTEARQLAARELADDLASDISEADVDTLKKSIEQVSTDNAMAEVGATRAKRILDRLGDSPTARALYRVFVDVASETAAKVLKQGP